MGSFRQGQGGRSGGFDRGNRSGGSRFGGGRPGGNRFGGGRDSRGPAQMFEATCSKCGKQCQVPFRPTGSKPVLCSECFRGGDGGTNFTPRNFDRPQQTGMSTGQLAEINAKLDKILKVLQDLEIDTGDEDEDIEGDETLDEDEEEEESDQ